jgi:hypothetical protein
MITGPHLFLLLLQTDALLVNLGMNAEKESATKLEETDCKANFELRLAVMFLLLLDSARGDF